MQETAEGGKQLAEQKIALEAAHKAAEVRCHCVPSSSFSGACELLYMWVTLMMLGYRLLTTDSCKLAHSLGFSSIVRVLSSSALNPDCLQSSPTSPSACLAVR